MAIWEERNRLAIYRRAAHERTLAQIWGVQKPNGIPILIDDFLPPGFLPPVVVPPAAAADLAKMRQAMAGQVSEEDVPAWAKTGRGKKPQRGRRQAKPVRRLPGGVNHGE